MKSSLPAVEVTISLSNVLKGAMVQSVDDIRPIPVKAVVLPRQAVTTELDEVDTIDPASVLLGAQQEAEELLALARKTAEQLVSEAHASAAAVGEAARADGYQGGFQQGLLDGRDEGLRSFQQQVDEVQRMAQAVKQSHVDWLSAMPASLTQVVSVALRHLLLRELALSPVDIEQHVIHLLQHVVDAAELEIHVHPDDFEQAKSAHGAWQSSRYGSWVLNIIPDLSMHPGGAELRSNTGRVDGTIETQLSRLTDVLHDLLERGLADAISHPVF